MNTPHDALILFSHGSLLCGAGENLRRLAEGMRERGDAAMVEVGYLNYSEPSFEDAFAKCVQAGAGRITVVPYFLVAGKFVTVDLAPKIDAMRDAHPGIEVRVADAMRFHPLLADAILACAERTAPPGAWRHILQAAPQFCRADVRCPLFGGPSCPATAETDGDTETATRCLTVAAASVSPSGSHDV